MRVCLVLFLVIQVICSQSQNIILNDNSFVQLPEPASAVSTANSLNNHTASNANVIPLSPATISAADQIWIVLPLSDFSQDIINALIQALVESKRLVFIGDHHDSFSEINSRINDMLNQIGASSRLGTNVLFSGCQSAPGPLGPRRAPAR